METDQEVIRNFDLDTMETAMIVQCIAEMRAQTNSEFNNQF